MVIEEFWLKRGAAPFGGYRLRKKVLSAVWVRVSVRGRVGWVDARGAVPALSKQNL